MKCCVSVLVTQPFLLSLPRKHEEANKQRKLTKQQKRAKTLRKLTEDTSTGVEVNVFRITDLSNQSIKFKVDTNAQQLHLTGCLLLNKELNLVVVEGGTYIQHCCFVWCVSMYVCVWCMWCGRRVFMWCVSVVRMFVVW